LSALRGRRGGRQGQWQQALALAGRVAL